MPAHLDGVDEGTERLLMGSAVSSGREGTGVTRPSVLDLSLYLCQHMVAGAALSGCRAGPVRSWESGQQLGSNPSSTGYRPCASRESAIAQPRFPHLGVEQRRAAPGGQLTHLSPWFWCNKGLCWVGQGGRGPGMAS